MRPCIPIRLLFFVALLGLGGFVPGLQACSSSDAGTADKLAAKGVTPSGELQPTKESSSKDQACLGIRCNHTESFGLRQLPQSFEPKNTDRDSLFSCPASDGSRPTYWGFHRARFGDTCYWAPRLQTLLELGIRLQI